MTFIQTFAALTSGKPKPAEDAIAYPKPPVLSPIKLSAADKAARAKASKALANAKQRCVNPKNPDYANYGGVGIKVLFQGVAELVADIGLPKADQSLDRIDPNAHYEPGNVRWASAAVQAANKKTSAAAVHYSMLAQVINAQDALKQRKNRVQVTKSWQIMLRAYQRGYLTETEVSSLSSTLTCPGVIEANFDLDTVPDMANPEPGYIHLPSLSLPGARIRLRCEPVDPDKVDNTLHRYGRLAGLERLEAEYNVPLTIWKKAISMMASSQPGLALVGQPNTEVLLGGWIEGALLGMASGLNGKHAKLAVFTPMLALVETLSVIGSPAAWEEVYDPVLDSSVLLIPDLCLDCGAWGELPPNHFWKIRDLLEYRYDKGLQTVVGLQNVSKLPSSLREIVLGAYTVLEMPKTNPHSTKPLKFSDEHWGIPNSGRILKMLSNDPDTKRLVQRIGVLGF